MSNIPLSQLLLLELFFLVFFAGIKLLSRNTPSSMLSNSEELLSIEFVLDNISFSSFGFLKWNLKYKKCYLNLLQFLCIFYKENENQKLNGISLLKVITLISVLLLITVYPRWVFLPPFDETFDGSFLDKLTVKLTFHVFYAFSDQPQSNDRENRNFIDTRFLRQNALI